MSEFSKELDGEQKRISGENIRINYSDKMFYERFFFDYTNEKKSLSIGHDAEFVQKQHIKKLQSMELEMTEEISPMLFSDVNGSSFKDERYILKRLYKPFIRTVRLKDKKGRSFERKQNIYADANIISPRPNSIADNEKLYCPHCGKISELKQLEQGCEGCGKSSFITGLFPKVKSFFYRKSNTISITDIGKTLLLCCITGILIGIPFGIADFIEDISGIFTRNTISRSIAGAFTAPFKGVMAGIVAAVIILLIRLIHDNIKNLPLIAKSSEAKKRISMAVSEQETSFCFEDFEAKLISLIKLVLYCDDRQNLVNCQPEGHVRKFDIADSIYDGFMELKNIHIEYNVCQITLEVYMTNIYYTGKKFIQKNDIFIVTLSKRLSKKTGVDFEMSNVTCPLCFEHFNAYENKECSFCATEYRIDDKDWVLTDLKIK